MLLLAGWIAFAGTAAHDWLFVTLVFALGALSFGVGSTLFSQGLYAASDAPMLGSSLTTAAFNVGTVIGPSLGGASIHTALGYRGPLWVSVMLAALALVVTLCGLQARRRTRRAVTSARWS
ncbi:Probable chloramphenicol resistance protein [Mycobacteroides abscessus]|nr:Probable chloramphenicol resistance protein [Mycobacteroides abscessus]